MRKALLYILATVFLVATPSSAALYHYYQQLGQQLPTIQERAIDAAEVGIFGYKGTKEQNILLEERLREVSGNPGDIGITVTSRYRTTLLGSMTSNQTSIPVSSLETFDGDTLTMDLLGGVVYLTIEPGLSREEIVKCTSISVGRFSDCTRGLKFSGTDESGTAANRFAHNAGSVVVMSNVHYVYENFLDKTGDQTIYGAITFNVPPVSTTTATTTYQLPNWGQVTSTLASYPTLAGNNAFSGTNSFSNTATFTGTVTVPYSTASSSAASVGLVNDTANAGAADAATTTKGIAKLSVDPVSPTNPIVVGDNDPRLGRLATTTFITTTGTSTWAVPSGITSIYVQVQGPGGNGGQNNGSDTSGSGGGGGGYSAERINVSSTSTIQMFVGTTGQRTEFGTNGFYLYATSGATGQDGREKQGGLGGCGFNGDLNICGSSGVHTDNITSLQIGSNGGSSVYGAGGRGSLGDGTGENGTGYGGGGGGGSQAGSSGGGSGGTGSQGLIVITY